ncbi:hypothetical protein DV965_14470, partial [Staphylococcus pseudintermedius]|uniref:YlbF family regulator n=1 Tax=Staphylococcus pseudintermedius TaxID=283734 RepID=UPI000E38341A
MYSREMILDSAQKLSASIQSLETIQHYQRIETKLHQNEQLAQYMEQLKQKQNQSVHFTHYAKHFSFPRFSYNIKQIQTKT